MKKFCLSLIVLVFLCGGALAVKSFLIHPSLSISPFEANVDVLTDNELCPGELLNCESGGERCLYYFDGKNYNIETKRNKR